MAETGNQRDLTKGEKTKYRLARAMKECMKSTLVENITVKQITEECGLTRQTFYRNFLDKYDLINWYFDKLLVKSFEHMGRGKNSLRCACEEVYLYSGRADIFCCGISL